MYLYGGIGINLINLVFFKYAQNLIKFFLPENSSPANFFSSLPEIILPLAISFYTFQIIAFIVDSYKGDAKDVSFLDYILFIFFFPQLIAGPIMRHSDFFPQMGKVELTNQKSKIAILLILSGLFKKVLLADQMAKIINPVWADPSHQSGLSMLLAILGFSVQIYADFSGYTDIARGSALFLGYQIPENFRSPYFSISFSELWSRWHITLSTWLRDYLYIPMGGNRVSTWRHNVNSIVVMSLGGLWHGNTITYVLWGFVHGIFLSIERKIGKATLNSKVIFIIIGWIFVSIGWLICVMIFRSGNWDHFVLVLSSFGNSGKSIILTEGFINIIILCYAVQFFQYKDYFHLKIKWKLTWLIPALAIILYFSIVRIQIVQDQFIYFQF